MDGSYKSFRKRILKVYEKKNFKIKNSANSRDAYRWLVKHKYIKVPETVFSTIIRSVNNALIMELLSGKDVKFPHNMGGIELRKIPVKKKLVNGELVTNLPIDWNSTLHLWNEDEEAYRDKVLIKADIRELFTIHFKKSKAKFKNMLYYNFKPIRRIKKCLCEKINNDEIDAFLKYEVH